ncbi:MAG: hypothetical protein U0792_25440 [Gemmataceae bacterium]
MCVQLLKKPCTLSLGPIALQFGELIFWDRIRRFRENRYRFSELVGFENGKVRSLSHDLEGNVFGMDVAEEVIATLTVETTIPP